MGKGVAGPGVKGNGSWRLGVGVAGKGRVSGEGRVDREGGWAGWDWG